MKNIVILIHKKRNDIERFLEEFPNCYIYADQEIESDNSFLVQIEQTGRNSKNIIANGIRHIHEDLTDHNLVLVNEEVSVEDVKKMVEANEKNSGVIIAKSSNSYNISKKKLLGIKSITKIFNMVHKQKANNIISNVQVIPSEFLEYFLKLKGDTASILINERFIIKDHNIDYKYIDVDSNVLTDAPESLIEYLKCIAIICFVFIKFMISSISAFLVDYTLALIGYALWSPVIVNFLLNYGKSVPTFLLDVEIVSIVIARIISSIYNYTFNKKVVFEANNNVAKLSTCCKYFTLVLIILAFNTIILKMVTTYLHIPFGFAKIMADGIMYLLSFKIQRDFVFNKKK